MNKLLLVIALMFTTLSLSAQESEQSAKEQIEKLNSCYQHLQDSYIDEVPFDKCVEGAIIATLKELDPHSTYLTKAEVDAAMSSLGGNFSGIGIRYIIVDSVVVVRGIEPSSPALKAGLGHNDRITAIEGKPVSEYEDVMSALKGKKGSKVSVDVTRARTHETSTITITRNNIEVSAIDASHIIDDKIGYIKISHFSRNVDQEFQRAVKRLGKFETLIIDLRGNSGGVLTSAIQLCDLFLDEGEIIVTTEGRSERYEYASRTRGSLFGTPIIVLINEESASASEIFAGAIQDHDRGIIMGTTSFGKGLVQRQIPFNDGSAMRITIAHYKTPSGRIIQRPYDKGHSEEYFNDITRFNHPDSLQQDSSLIFHTLRQGRTVYGNGGITPDVYIGHDTRELPSYMATAYRSNAFQLSLIELWDNLSPEDIRRDYPTLQAYDKGYEVDAIIIDSFCKIVGDESAREDRELLYPLLKAQIAEDVYGKGSYQYIYNRHYDTTLIRAIELAKDREAMEAILGVSF